MTDQLDVASVRRRLIELGADAGSVGRVISYSAETGSTNDDAAEGARSGVADGSVYVSDYQSRGRGRRGRTWLSPACESLTFSVVVRPRVAVDNPSTISLAVGLGVLDALVGFVGNGVGIKWPNDVLVGSRKIAGVLVEASFAGECCQHMIIGIGINVLQTHFDPSIAAVATSLLMEGAKSVCREGVLAAVLMSVDRRVGQYFRQGLRSMLVDLRERDMTVGRLVRVGNVQGVADGVDEGGGLRVDLGGAVRVVSAGECEVVRCA